MDNNFVHAELGFAVPPGDIISEYLETIGMTQSELATRLKLTPKTMTGIINGKAPISVKTARGLESVFNRPAKFWLDLESSYRLAKDRLESKIEESERTALRETPYAEMQAYGWVPSTSNRSERCFHLRNFYRVASLSQVSQMPYAMASSFRSSSKKRNLYAAYAWLQKAEDLGRLQETPKYNREKLLLSIPSLRALTKCTDYTLGHSIKEILCSCGVAVAFVRLLPNDSICGASRWLTPEKPLISVSSRGNILDSFWFTLFHEIGHIIKEHGKKNILISSDTDEDVTPQFEKEADLFAKNTLIQPEDYEKILNKSLSIEEYSEKSNVHISIVYGRLAKDNLITWPSISKYRKQLPEGMFM